MSSPSTSLSAATTPSAGAAQQPTTWPYYVVCLGCIITIITLTVLGVKRHNAEVAAANAS